MIQMPWWAVILLILGCAALGAAVALIIFAWRFGKGMNW
jgi:hypothetical protein